MRVKIINSNPDYSTMFCKQGWKIVDPIDKADLIQFTGGSDVSPNLYGEAQHKSTVCNPNRDAKEAIIFNLALKKGIPMAGICRGGQFLNVMCGGRMWQHVNNHAIYGTHAIQNKLTGMEFQGTSTHHQLMKASKKGVVICTAKEATRLEKMGGDKKISMPLTILHSNHQDTESVYYHSQKVFCFQPHPEFPGYEKLVKEYFNLLKICLFSANPPTH